MPEKSTNRKRLTPQQRKELDITIGFLEGIVRRDPAYVDALQLLGDDYTRSGKYVSGLQVDERLARLRPEDPLVHYNLACSYSLTGKLDQAAAALDRALDQGYRDFNWLAKDPDLKKLRAHETFAELKDKIRRLRS